MKSFELYEPTSVQEAVGILTKFGTKAKILAGGSDLVAGIMKDWVQGDGMPLPDALVDLTTIPQLRGIRIDRNGATIGATTTLTDIVESQELGQQFPLLGQAAHSVASPLIRNSGTLGGNINQRPRCWFFRGQDFNCYKKGGDICFSVTGDNRHHAIIGGELCYIVHPSDTATALLALNAQAKIAGPAGERTIPFDNYFIGPREDVLRENVLKPDELLLEVFVPAPTQGAKQAWMKLKDRQVYDFAIVAVAAVFTVEGDTWRDGRIVLGGVSPVPYRAQVVENQLKGKSIRSSIRQAAAAIRTVARPMSMNAYKVDVAQNLIERTIVAALA
ncbi:MAG: xanthine dehydrogenase family protein subunit M [Gemmatimonadetes bacterium]|nr:xanthine dehydrogenase family protein subunit M [Gemmatimonadota bacterium]